jgi:hypothetical protein
MTVRMTCSVIPLGGPGGESLLPHITAATAHISTGVRQDGATETAFYLEDRAATYLQIHGQLSVAIALFERTHIDRERVLGPDHPHTLNSRNNLARAYRDAARLGEAIALFERTLTDRERS